MRPYSQKEQLIGQLTFMWEALFRPNFDGLTDEELLWEPVQNIWTVKVSPDGSSAIDWGQTGDPVDPVTTIAWLINHMDEVLTDRYLKHYEGRRLSPEDYRPSVSASEALQSLDAAYARWLQALESSPESRFLQPCGPMEGPYADEPFAMLVLQINREIIYHGAEANLLLDLKRNAVSSPARGN